MKKLLSVFAILIALGTANVFAATGIGLQAGPVVTNNGVAFDGAVTFKIDSLPWVFAVDIPSFNPFAIGITADYWIGSSKIQQNWGWFYGAGAAIALYTGSYPIFGIGARCFIGTNVYLINKFLELYADIAWQPMIYIHNGVSANLLNFPVNVGFRFWF